MTDDKPDPKVDPAMSVTTGRPVLGAPTLTINPPAKPKEKSAKDQPPATGKQDDAADQDND